MPRTKSITAGPLKKRKTGEGPSRGNEPPRFQDPNHRKRYGKNLQRRIGESRCCDWRALERIGLSGEVEQLMSVGAWRRFFDITDPTYQELTMEVLSSFELDRTVISLTRDDTISFQVFGEQVRLSYTRFSELMGLYDVEYTQTDEYSRLHVALPGALSDARVWGGVLGGRPQYTCGQSKASQLGRPAYRYIHNLLAHTLTGRGDSTGVVNQRDIFFLWSMVAEEPIHLGHALAHYLWHQAHHPRSTVIFAGPYITRLVRGMEMGQHTTGMAIRGGFRPLGISTMTTMHMIRLRDTPHGPAYTFEHRPGSVSPPPDDSQSDSERTGDASAPEPALEAGEPSSATRAPPARPAEQPRTQDRLARLEQQVVDLQRMIETGQQAIMTQLQQILAHLERPVEPASPAPSPAPAEIPTAEPEVAAPSVQPDISASARVATPEHPGSPAETVSAPAEADPASEHPTD